jgi:hypothetical protein
VIDQSHDAFRQLAMDRIFIDVAKSWRSATAVGGILGYCAPNVLEGMDDDSASLEQQFDCQALCRTFMARLKGRTAAYAPGGIKTAYDQGDVAEGYAFLFVVEPPVGIHPSIFRKIINDCWDHCADRIKSISIEDVDAEFAASVALKARPSPC